MRSAEERKSLIIDIVGYSVIGILFFLTLTITLGDRFFGMMSLLGLDSLRHSGGWMYVDCSLEENQHMKFCLPKETTMDKDWKDIKRSGKDYIPFNLSPGDWEK